MSQIFILYNEIMFEYQNTSLGRIKSHRFIFKDTPTICFLTEIWLETIVWSFRHT